MNHQQLALIAKQLVAPKKGILAADESTSTIGKRFDGIGVENTKENRQAYRELLFTTQAIEQYISGVILFDETIRQSATDAVAFPKLLEQKGIIPGIKVDLGKDAAPDSPSETITKGLEGLPERLVEYYALGARFAKWRAEIYIGEGIPTESVVRENVKRLAQYAKMCQEAAVVPIVEPEVLMDGNHSIERCLDVTVMVLEELYQELAKQEVSLEGTLLKPNMVVAGLGAPVVPSAEEVAQHTISALNIAVPPSVAGVVFLSGGQSETQACENLSAINVFGAQKKSPWPLSFSFGRALQASALSAWQGKRENVSAAQAAFLAQAARCSQAVMGELST